MSNTQDKFVLLRRDYIAKIGRFEAEIGKLRSKLEMLDEMEKEANAVSNSGDQVIEIVKHPVPIALIEKGLTEAVLETLGTLGSGQGSAVRRALLATGFVPKGKNFDVSVNTALKRLALQGKIKTEVVEGRRIYMKK